MQKTVQEHTLRVNDYPIPVTLNEAWVKFIERFEPYRWYATLTFKNEVTQGRAEKQFRRFIRLINESLYGRCYRNRGTGVSWVKAIERQRRGVLHFHTLIGGEVWRLRRFTYMDLWREGGFFSNGKRFQANGFAKIEKYKRKLGARHYLSKYVTKGGELDIFIPKYMYEFYGLREGENSFKFLQ